jgi:hypothetical protein
MPLSLNNLNKFISNILALSSSLLASTTTHTLLNYSLVESFSFAAAAAAASVLYFILLLLRVTCFSV